MKRPAALLGLVCCLAVPAFAADKEVEDLLAKMREVYKATKSAKFTVKAKFAGPMGDAEITSEVDFKGPNSFRAESTGVPDSVEPKVVMVTDGKKIQISGVAPTRIDLDWSLDAAQQVPGNLETLSFWDWERQLNTGPQGNMKTSTFKLINEEEWNDKKWIVLEETAQEQQVSVRYFIDPATSYIWRSVMKSLDGGQELMDARIDKLEINPEIADSVFEIK